MQRMYYYFTNGIRLKEGIIRGDAINVSIKSATSDRSLVDDVHRRDLNLVSKHSNDEDPSRNRS